MGELLNSKHLVSFCKILWKDVYPLIQSDAKLSAELEGNVTDFENAVSKLESFIRDRDENLNGGHIHKLRDLAMDARDELDLCLCKMKRNSSLTRPFIPSSIDCSKAAEKTKEFCKEVKELHQKPDRQSNPEHGEERRDHLSEHLYHSLEQPRRGEKPIGFDDHAEKIRNLLHDHETALLVVSIVGMAGQGKTTLAKMVYDDPIVRERPFGFRAWVPVSQQYIRRNTNVLQIINTGAASDEKKLRSTLQDKRCLIVLDDVWHSKPLDDLVQIFGDNRKASRIIVTSRFKIVPERHNPRLYQLTPLCDEQSWELYLSMLIKTS